MKRRGRPRKEPAAQQMANAVRSLILLNEGLSSDEAGYVLNHQHLNPAYYLDPNLEDNGLSWVLGVIKSFIREYPREL